jgi:hypothetical protein
MSAWLFVGMIGVSRHADIDKEQYQRTAFKLASHVEDAVGRAVGGAAWLRRRFAARSVVNIELTVSASDRLEVGRLRTEDYDGPTEITCRVGMPAGWFTEPGDGLLGIRYLRTVLHTLDTIGKDYDLGPPPLRSAKAGAGKPPLTDLFAPQPIEPSIFQQAAESVYRLTTGIGPDQLVLSAVEPARREIQRKRLAVAQNLGIVESEHTFAAGEEQQIRAWQIRRTS